MRHPAISTSKGNRLLLSILALASTAILSGVVSALVDALERAAKPFASAVYYPVTFFACSLPGWILALPFVLFVQNIDRWRFVMYLVIGAAIGPFLLAGIGAYTWSTSTNPAGWAPEAKNLIWLSFAVSTTTTLIYLVLLKRSQRMKSNSPIG